MTKELEKTLEYEYGLELVTCIEKVKNVTKYPGTYNIIKNGIVKTNRHANSLMIEIVMETIKHESESLGLDYREPLCCSFILAKFFPITITLDIDEYKSNLSLLQTTDYNQSVWYACRYGSLQISGFEAKNLGYTNHPSYLLGDWEEATRLGVRSYAQTNDIIKYCLKTSNLSQKEITKKHDIFFKALDML